MRTSEEWIGRELAGLDSDDLLRRIQVFSGAGGIVLVDGHRCLNFSSNDYLDLARNMEVKDRAAEYMTKFGAGAGASRLVTGTLPCHEELETRLARLKGYPAALVLGSGYLANGGTIPALAGRGDCVFADRLVHASILDGIALSGARLVRFHHNDHAHLAELLEKAPQTGRRLIVTDSVFSMDGDIAPLAEFAGIATTHGAMLMVDEAHSTGVFGPGGAGLVRALGLEPAVNISMATLSKALGSYGGFVACSAQMRELLVNRARAFIYTTALPPASAGAAMAALDILEREPDMGKRLLDSAGFLRTKFRGAGLDTGQSESQIVPVMVGESGKALKLSKRLMEQGIIAVAIRPPTVPKNSARLRFSITLAHGRGDLERAADIVVSYAKAEGLI